MTKARNMKKVLRKYLKSPPRETLIIYAVGAGIVLILFLTLYFTVGKSLTAFVSDADGFKKWLSSYEELGAAVFVFIRAFQTVIKIIPAEPLEIASGYAFGTFGGLALCSLGSLLGSLVIVLLSRTLSEKFINAFVNREELERILSSVNKSSKRVFLWVFYLIPGTPKDLLTYAAGAFDISLAEFFLITTAARVPSIITSTLCGAQLGNKNYAAAIIVFAATAAVSLLCTAVYKKHRQKNNNNE